jgi:hypothetical protein
MYTLAGFDLLTQMLPSGDDTSRPGCQGLNLHCRCVHLSDMKNIGTYVRNQ